MYKCPKCNKWFEKAKISRDKRYNEDITICPTCGKRVYQRTGLMPILVALWWWIKEFFRGR